MYEARAEPALSTRHSLVISYNVNSEAVTTGCVPMSAFTNTLTLPRFVAVPMSAFGRRRGRARQPGAGADRPAIRRSCSRTHPSGSTRGATPTAARRCPRWRRCEPGPRAGRVTLSWPDVGLRIRYHVSLQGPGEPGDAPVKITQKTGATITGLQPGDYQATVVPVNFKQQTGRAAEVTFTVP